MKKIITGMLLAFSLVSVASASNVQTIQGTYNIHDAKTFSYIYFAGTKECEFIPKNQRIVFKGMKTQAIVGSDMTILIVDVGDNQAAPMFENKQNCLSYGYAFQHRNR